MKKELFKGELIALKLQENRPEGEVDDAFIPRVQIVRELMSSAIGISQDSENISFCPFCGQKIEIKEEPLKKKF